MKGLTGLVVASALGLLGVGINMAYLHNKTKNIDTVSFVGIRDGTSIPVGTTIKLGDLEKVPIPTNRAKSLTNYVFKWESRHTVAGMKANRDLEGGDLVLLEYYKTPPPELALAAGEVLWPIEVNTISPLIEPGDEVSFLVPTMPMATGPPVTPEGAGPGPPPPGVTSSNQVVKMHGPFRVGAIGNRISSAKVARGHKIPQRNQNQLGIIVKLEGQQLEAKAMTLIAALATISNRSVTVVKHGRRNDSK